MKTSSALVLAGLAVQQGSATFTDWTKYTPFRTPETSNNQCVDRQSRGWSFDDLQIGQFKSFSSFDFNGFSCSKKYARRDLLSKRTGFGGNSITGTLSTKGGPSFSCGSSTKGFSATGFQISVDRTVDIEFHYTYEDGSKCSHVSRCQAGGTTVKNSQCGGAKTVTFKLPSNDKGGDCDFGIHRVDFDCNPPKVNPPPASSNPPSSSRPPTTSTTSSSSSTSTTSTTTSTPTSSNPPPPPPSSSRPGSSSNPPPPPSSSSRPAISSNPPPPPASSSSRPGVSSNPPPPPPSSATSRTGIFTTSTTETTALASSSSTTSTSSPQPEPTSPCPDVLPKCLSTWLHLTQCKDNSDASCFCKSTEFVNKVYGCLSSWGKESPEVQDAASYFVGVCGKFIPENPGIITDCPNSITILPPSNTAPATLTTQVVVTTLTTCPPGQTVTQGTVTSVLTAPSVSTVYVTSTSTVCNRCSGGTLTVPVQPQQPLTTITIDQKITVPCTFTAGNSSGLVIPSSFTTTNLATTVTVPQVQFTTGSFDGTSSGVQLAPPAPPTAVPPPGVTNSGATSTATSAAATTSSPITFNNGGFTGTGTTLRVSATPNRGPPPPLQFTGAAAPRATGAAMAGLAVIVGAVFAL